MEIKSLKMIIAIKYYEHIIICHHHDDFISMAMSRYRKVNSNCSQHQHIISQLQAHAIPSAHGPRTISGRWLSGFQSLIFPLASGCQFMHLFNWATILADTGKVHAFPKANPNSRAVKLSSDSKVVGLHPMTLTFSCCGVWRGGNPNGVKCGINYLKIPNLWMTYFRHQFIK